MNITTETKAAMVNRAELAAMIGRVAETGDRTAFADLFRYFAPRIKGYLQRLGAQPAQAEELTQDIMLTVWRKAKSYDPAQASVSTWIFTIARNRRIDALRRERHVEIDPDDPMLVPDSEPAPDESMLMAQREERLVMAIRDLPPEQVDLLDRAFFAGKTHREIAEETGLPLGTVKSRLRLAFTRLRRILDGSV